MAARNRQQQQGGRAVQRSSKIGRPRKAPHERRSASRFIRWTLAEDAYLREQAAQTKSGSVSEFVRRRALGLPVEVRQTKASARLIHELNAIGVNLNQISRNLNSGRRNARTVELESLMGKLSDVLDQVVEEFEPSA